MSTKEIPQVNDALSLAYALRMRVPDLNVRLVTGREWADLVNGGTRYVSDTLVRIPPEWGRALEDGSRTSKRMLKSWLKILGEHLDEDVLAMYNAARSEHLERERLRREAEEARPAEDRYRDRVTARLKADEEQLAKYVTSLQKDVLHTITWHYDSMLQLAVRINLYKSILQELARGQKLREIYETVREEVITRARSSSGHDDERRAGLMALAEEIDNIKHSGLLR